MNRLWKALDVVLRSFTLCSEWFYSSEWHGQISVSEGLHSRRVLSRSQEGRESC